MGMIISTTLDNQVYDHWLQLGQASKPGWERYFQVSQGHGAILIGLFY